MKLNEIKKVGFYRAINDKKPNYIFEVFKNTDKEWLKDNPQAKLLVDEWGYEYTDEEDRRHYETFGRLMQVQNADKIEVKKMTESFVISGKSGNHLTENKPTYKEKCILMQKLCKNQDLELQRLKAENEELKHRINSFICSENCFRAVQANNYKQALLQVQRYCNECNLKADDTACEVLNIINEVLADE